MLNEETPTIRVQQSFDRQGMMQHLGARLLQVEPGLCVIALGNENACAVMQQTLMPVPKSY